MKIIAIGGFVAVATLAACAPPKIGQPAYVKACTEAVTTVNDGQPLPCVPTPPQRVDVLIQIVNGDTVTAVLRCGALGGAPVGPYSSADATLRCRSVTA